MVAMSVFDVHRVKTYWLEPNFLGLVLDELHPQHFEIRISLDPISSLYGNSLGRLLPITVTVSSRTRNER